MKTNQKYQYFFLFLFFFCKSAKEDIFYDHLRTLKDKRGTKTAPKLHVSLKPGVALQMASRGFCPDLPPPPCQSYLVETLWNFYFGENCHGNLASECGFCCTIKHWRAKCTRGDKWRRVATPSCDVTARDGVEQISGSRRTRASDSLLLLYFCHAGCHVCDKRCAMRMQTWSGGKVGAGTWKDVQVRDGAWRATFPLPPWRCLNVAYLICRSRWQRTTTRHKHTQTHAGLVCSKAASILAGVRQCVLIMLR